MNGDVLLGHPPKASRHEGATNGPAINSPLRVRCRRSSAFQRVRMASALCGLVPGGVSPGQFPPKRIGHLLEPALAAILGLLEFKSVHLLAEERIIRGAV